MVVRLRILNIKLKFFPDVIGVLQNSKQEENTNFFKGLYQEGLSDVFGEGNGTPLQYSCLENPMDGGAWQAAVHGVARVGHD